MKKFLSTAAIALVMGTGAYAAGHSGALLDMEFDSQSNVYASELIGMRVYATEAETGPQMTEADEGWDDIGEINDVVLSRDGSVDAVIVGVGGFLGLGEKDVAVAMNQIKFVADEDDEGDYFLVLNASRDMIEQASDYERADISTEVEEGDVAETDMAMDETADDMEKPMTKDMAETSMEENGAAEDAMSEDGMADDGEIVDEEVVTTMSTAERDMLMRPDVMVTGYQTADPAELTSENLTGARVYGENDEDVGEVSELILSDDGRVELAILDIGGFLGLGEHSIAVTFEELNIQRSEDGDEFRVYVDATEDALKNQPAYEG
ncbi:PRC-barrel domain-containing protein [Donghicola sp. XS_ASV15]|uniref:PRC-barrel domain-containing protein n=1 Tax=Donghicola sp. XS_ASV15 TaxID=3241295 RepID=UPI003511994D